MSNDNIVYEFLRWEAEKSTHLFSIFTFLQDTKWKGVWTFYFKNVNELIWHSKGSWINVLKNTPYSKACFNIIIRIDSINLYVILNNYLMMSPMIKEWVMLIKSWTYFSWLNTLFKPFGRWIAKVILQIID